ncbi:MAG: hypothetical protein KF819_09535 [Labilithrix sp.]|nr:hypothetical protein [Labilithrix sp.]
MDAIERNDLEWARQTPPAEKLATALKMMRLGIGLKRSALAAAHPNATEGEIDALLQAWLDADG